MRGVTEGIEQHAYRVDYTLSARATAAEIERALPRRLALELFDTWCPFRRASGRASAAVAKLALALGGRLSEDPMALRERVREALRDGRLLACRAGRGVVHAAAPLQEKIEAREPAIQEKLEDICIVTVEDGTWRLLSGIKLTITSTSGSKTPKDTDSDGAAELRDMRPGLCRVGAVFDGATLPTCYEVVGIDPGQPPSAADDERQGDEGRDERKFALTLKRHKVATGETLASVAEAYGMTWQQLAKFNFGSTAPRDVNRGLRNQVGCRRKTADRANYVLDSDDNPGILFIPRPWDHSGLHTDRTYTLRLRVPRVERIRQFIFSM